MKSVGIAELIGGIEHDTAFFMRERHDAFSFAPNASCGRYF